LNDCYGVSLRCPAAGAGVRCRVSREGALNTHNLLSGVFDWFTEGFETADLKDAKALLEKLK